MDRLLKSFAALPDKMAPAFRGDDLREHVQLPLPKHLAPEIVKGKGIHGETLSSIGQVLNEK